MKILITGTTGDSMPPPYGGIPKVSLLYAREWIKLGHEVALTFVYQPVGADDFGAKAKYYFEYSAKPNKISKALFLLKYFFQQPISYIKLLSSYYKIYPHLSLEVILYSAYGVYMGGVISEYKPDVILGEAALIKTFMVAEISRKKKIPLVVDSYAEIKDPKMGVNKNLSEDQKNKYWKYFLNMAELVLGISNCTVGAQKYLPENKVRAFYDTCDFSKYGFGVTGDREKLRDYFKIPRDLFMIGAVGAFEARKGHDDLIKAVSLLVGKGHKVGVAICGGSGDSSKWKALAESEGIVDRVFLFKRLSENDLRDFYKTLDVYSNLSNSERSCGLDLALLEGMASGLPIIVYNNGGLKEAVIEGSNGYVVSTGHYEDVAVAIGKLMGISAEERAKMGRESATYSEKYDIKKTAKIKLEWLKEVVINYK